MNIHAYQILLRDHLKKQQKCTSQCNREEKISEIIQVYVHSQGTYIYYAYYYFYNVSFGFDGCPAMETKLIQYLLPFPSGKLCPKCVPSILTVSPFGKIRTCC